jgi:hypothetical protein
LNEMKRTRLSPRRTIWLLRPQYLCVSPGELTDGRGWEEEELLHTTARKPGPL